MTGEDVRAYTAYLEKTDDSQVLADGTYQLSTNGNPNTGFSADYNEGITVIGRPSLSKTSLPVETVFYQGTTWIYHTYDDSYGEYNYYLTVSNNAEKERQLLTLIPFDINNKNQRWLVKRAGEGEGFYILYESQFALTYDLDTGTVYVSSFTGNNNQIWQMNTITTQDAM